MHYLLNLSTITWNKAKTLKIKNSIYKKCSFTVWVIWIVLTSTFSCILKTENKRYVTVLALSTSAFIQAVFLPGLKQVKQKSTFMYICLIWLPLKNITLILICRLIMHDVSHNQNSKLLWNDKMQFETIFTYFYNVYICNIVTQKK